VNGLKPSFNAAAVHVLLNIPVEADWNISDAVYNPQDPSIVPLIVVEFSKAGEESVYARLDLGKQWFIDTIPMKDYADRRSEVYSLAGKVTKAIEAHKKLSALKP
jgi:hypothetical protein